MLLAALASINGGRALFERRAGVTSRRAGAPEETGSRGAPVAESRVPSPTRRRRRLLPPSAPIGSRVRRAQLGHDRVEMQHYRAKCLLILMNVYSNS
ncbi:unnamed protein product, partial [Iphiclides podalirius]